MASDIEFNDDSEIEQTLCGCYRMAPSAIWEIFSEFLIFCNLFHKPLGG